MKPLPDKPDKIWLYEQKLRADTYRKMIEAAVADGGDSFKWALCEVVHHPLESWAQDLSGPVPHFRSFLIAAADADPAFRQAMEAYVGPKKPRAKQPEHCSIRPLRAAEGGQLADIAEANASWSG